MTFVHTSHSPLTICPDCAETHKILPWSKLMENKGPLFYYRGDPPLNARFCWYHKRSPHAIRELPCPNHQSPSTTPSPLQQM